MKLPLNIDLKGKTAVVTGGGGVLCSTFAKAIAACGAKVAILDLREDVANKVAEEIVADGGIAIGVGANVLDKAVLENAKKIVNEKFGSCDILINGAGGNHPKGTTTNEYYFEGDIKKDITSFFDLDPQGVEFVFNLNFLGTLLPTQVFAADMLVLIVVGTVNTAVDTVVGQVQRCEHYDTVTVECKLDLLRYLIYLLNLFGNIAGKEH